MGRYDGPYFEVEDERVVSIWVAKVPFDGIPEDYFTVLSFDDDDAPFNQFSTDFGFGFYDDDFVEAHFRDDQGIASVEELLEPLSYSASFRDAAVAALQRIGIVETSYVFLMYNFRYEPQFTNVRPGAPFQFIGVFRYEIGAA
jgi:hypothetical protein